MSEESSNKKPKRRACAQTKKQLKRTEWYFRDGEYFMNKRAYSEWKTKKLEEQKKAEEEAKAAAEAKEAEATA